jgi:hypothetical protein
MAAAGRPPPAAARELLAWLAGTGLGAGVGLAPEARADAVKATT